MLSCTAPSSLLGKGGAWENRGRASMKTRTPLLGNASPFLLPIATALSAAAISVGDLFTDRTVCVATLFVVVVLMAGGFCRPRGVWLVAAGCAGLAVLDLLLSHETIPNTVISLAAI